MHIAHVPQANLNSPKIWGVGFMMGFLIVFRGELKKDSTKTLYTLLRLGYFVSLPYKFSIQMPCVEQALPAWVSSPGPSPIRGAVLPIHYWLENLRVAIRHYIQVG